MYIFQRLRCGIYEVYNLHLKLRIKAAHITIETKVYTVRF